MSVEILMFPGYDPDAPAPPEPPEQKDILPCSDILWQVSGAHEDEPLFGKVGLALGYTPVEHSQFMQVALLLLHNGERITISPHCLFHHHDSLLEYIAREVLGEHCHGFSIPDTMTAGELQQTWDELMQRKDQFATRFNGELQAAKTAKQSTKGKAQKEWREHIERLDGMCGYANAVCHHLFHDAYLVMHERLVAFANQHGIDPDNFSERVCTLFQDPFYLEATHNMKLSDIMEETRKEFIS